MNTGTIILFAAFGGIVLIMIAIAITGTKKDKTKRAVEVHNRNEKSEKANSQLDELWNELNDIIKWTIENSNKSKKSLPNALSLSDVNKQSKKKISVLIDSDKVRDIYEVDNYKSFVKPILVKLNKTRPSSWEKEAFFECNYIISKNEIINKFKDKDGDTENNSDSIDKEKTKLTKNKDNNLPKKDNNINTSKSTKLKNTSPKKKG
ncbi:MAG: hypothetical protein HRS57_01780 [Mycoplasmataceae bacterium]|nr:hypothetical protein [Mycoplasmataceae bacterium]